MLRSPSWPPLKTSTGRPKRQGATDGGEATGLGGDAAGERCGGGKGGGGCDDGGGCPAAATRTRTRSSDGTKLMVRCQTVTNAANATRGTQRGRLISSYARPPIIVHASSWNVWGSRARPFYVYHVSRTSGAPSRDDESGPTNASQFRIASASSLAERTARSSASPSWRGSLVYSRAARLPASTRTSYSARSSGKRAGSVVCARAG